MIFFCQTCSPRFVIPFRLTAQWKNHKPIYMLSQGCLNSLLPWTDYHKGFPLVRFHLNLWVVCHCSVLESKYKRLAFLSSSNRKTKQETSSISPHKVAAKYYLPATITPKIRTFPPKNSWEKIIVTLFVVKTCYYVFSAFIVALMQMWARSCKQFMVTKQLPCNGICFVTCAISGMGLACFCATT